MSRFRQIGEDPPYSELHPERLALADDGYITPESARERGVVRAIDNAPGLEELRRAARSDRANVGYRHLKGRP